ncbi:HK97 family phage major capsid protein [Sphingobium wenxiniae]|uniref:HK97 family phage major capsid protein n=1 Tax=Sphingobium wenxiniae (strain DSM 21828 / CGMCC 1.7748 / JZ-1) TaxID=595605 RepID=A0A562KKS3_SPHWJ|nr:phage major capsid protein [Sphingobium wenxiniae]MBB6191191.1 HK97 family phage major capsid protein [Sphingobium wenxiniae]TWH96010.1 HK97 family phage major capsid protein [Sphingobium wenxiniae]
MPSLTELQEKRGQLVTQAREALDAITANTDESRAAELEDRHDKIMVDFDKLEKDIAREERTARIEKEEAERRERNRPLNPDGETRSGEGEGGGDVQAEYRDAFYACMRDGGSVESLAAEQRDLLRRGHQELRVQIAGTASAGGYTVPKDLANEIVKTMKDWGPMYDGTIVRDITTGSGNEFDIPTNDDTGNSASALSEGADLPDDNSGDLEFGQKRLDAYVDATPWVKLSFELLQDSVFNLEEFLAEALGERLGRRANGRLTTGTGTGQANGVLTASTLGKTAASATAIAADELIELQHSVRAPYRRSPKCRWMFADTTLLAIRKLKDGEGNYLWTMGDVRVGAPSMLLDHPYSINDDVPSIAASAKSILFGDFSRYWVRKVGSPLIGTVRERFWPKVGMAGLIRYDGELVDSIAIKHLAQPAS